MKIVPLASQSLDAEQRRRLGRLNVIAYPEYYKGFGLEGDALDDMAAHMFEVDGGELSDTLIAVSDDGELCGFLSSLPSDDFQASASRTAFAVLKQVPRDGRKAAMAHMQAIGSGQDALPEGTYYLARVAVSPEMQGQGLAARLMDAFEGKGDGGPHVLHVAADNGRAIRFYEKRGYAVESGNDATLLMQRSSTV